MEQIAAAIRTHGMGLADNAVNVTYQFLARKVTMLSQVGTYLIICFAKGFFRLASACHKTQAHDYSHWCCE